MYFNIPSITPNACKKKGSRLQNVLREVFCIISTTGEASHAYFTCNYYWMDTPENANYTEPVIIVADLIKHIIPDVRLILILRDPVER